MPRVNYSVDRKKFNPTDAMREAAEVLLTSYCEQPGPRAVGASTIASNFSSKDGLVKSAVDALQRGEDIGRIWEANKDIGSMCHKLCENWLAGLTGEDLKKELKSPDGMGWTKEEWDGALEKAKIGLASFMSFWNGENFAQHATEMSLVCDETREAGTLDCIAEKSGGGRTIVDIKTKDFYRPDGSPKQIWPGISELIQVGVYANLCERGRLNRSHTLPNGYNWIFGPVEDAVIVYLSRQSAEFRVLRINNEDLQRGRALGMLFRAAHAVHTDFKGRFAPSAHDADDDDLAQVFAWAGENGFPANQADEEDPF